MEGNKRQSLPPRKKEKKALEPKIKTQHDASSLAHLRQGTGDNQERQPRRPLQWHKRRQLTLTTTLATAK